MASTNTFGTTFGGDENDTFGTTFGEHGEVEAPTVVVMKMSCAAISISL